MSYVAYQIAKMLFRAAVLQDTLSTHTLEWDFGDRPDSNRETAPAGGLLHKLRPCYGDPGWEVAWVIRHTDDVQYKRIDRNGMRERHWDGVRVKLRVFHLWLFWLAHRLAVTFHMPRCRGTAHVYNNNNNNNNNLSLSKNTASKVTVAMQKWAWFSSLENLQRPLE